jgi:hypothetical protein
MARYWIGVASKEHVQNGVIGGFAQVCHGKPGPLNSMEEGDWIIYYSPTLKFGGKEPCQSFTAIGKINVGKPYTFPMSPDFIPWRRDVSFLKSHEAPIQPLLDHLSFIKDKQKWGFPFRRGCFEISRDDFQVIAYTMGITNE